MNSPATQPPLAGQTLLSPARRSWPLRYPVATFLACLGLSFTAMPFEEKVRDGDLLESAVLTLVMLSGFLAIGERKHRFAWGLVLVAPALAGKWFDHWQPGRLPFAIFMAPALVFIAFVIAHLMRFILRARRIDSEVVSAAVANYLTLGLLCAFGYILMARLTPGAFAFGTGPDSGHVMKGFTALYFSFMTLTTVGYGDIAPVTGAARMLAMMEATTGTIYIAVLISRLVSLYSSMPPPPAKEESPPSPVK